MPKSHPKCGQCHQVITEGVVMAMGRCWHKDHFVCAHCRKPLKVTKYIEEDGHAYCESDWKALFKNTDSPKCAQCNLPITETPVSALGQTWHKNHFVCAHCNKPFMDTTFLTEDGKPYCETDHKALFGAQKATSTGAEQAPIIGAEQAPIIGAQQAPIIGVQQALSTGGQQAPGTKEQKVRSTSWSLQGQGQLNQIPICESCKEPVTGTVTFGLGKPWHKEHFVCTHCKKPINDAGFGIENEKPYCIKDYAALFGKKCSACNQMIEDVILTALNKPWHKKCFTCSKCKKPITAQQPFKEKNGVPMCAKCSV